MLSPWLMDESQSTGGSHRQTDSGFGEESGGILYIVSTPIGNLADISFRAVDILKFADFIAAEDTRQTARLLAHYNIRGRLISCHEHNEQEKSAFISEKLRHGASVALVSDAGTPTVSDPGYRVVTAAVEAGVRVVPIPGVSAAVAALSASGLPSDQFCFFGFLPKKKGRREQMLQRMSDSEGTLIFYESPKRLRGLLDALLENLGDRYAVIAREMTKVHEEFIRGPISALINEMAGRPAVKGEVTLLVSGKVDAGSDSEEIPETAVEEIKAALLSGEVSASALAARLSNALHIPKNRIYKHILSIKAELVK